MWYNLRRGFNTRGRYIVIPKQQTMTTAEGMFIFVFASILFIPFRYFKSGIRSGFNHI